MDKYQIPRALVKVQAKACLESPEYLGDYSTRGYGVTGVDSQLARTWKGMLQRCYNTSAPNFHLYGGKGVGVCTAWHDLATFISDVKKIPHWEYKLDDWEGFKLDKDYYGSNYYSPGTCIWAASGENSSYMSNVRMIKATDCFGGVKVFLSKMAAARHYGTSDNNIKIWCETGTITKAYSKQKWMLGWKFEYLEPDDLYRYALIPGSKSRERIVIAADIETTGLDPVGGRILEVCFHVLDDSFEILSTFEGVVHPTSDVQIGSFVFDMHSKNGLLEAEPTCTLREVGNWLSQYTNIVFLGSSVNFDKEWLEYHIEGLKTSHRVIDVSSLKGLVDITARLPETESNHRAASDIAYSLDVARLYRGVLLAS